MVKGPAWRAASGVGARRAHERNRGEDSGDGATRRGRAGHGMPPGRERASRCAARRGNSYAIGNALTMAVASVPPQSTATVEPGSTNSRRT